MRYGLIVGLSLALLQGCATGSQGIAARSVSPLQYQGFNCEQIAMEMARVSNRANDMARQVDADANADAWQLGVGLVLFWPALFFLEGGDGPQAHEYATLKGEYEALAQAGTMKSCGISTQQASAQAGPA